MKSSNRRMYRRTDGRRTKRDKKSSLELMVKAYIGIACCLIHIYNLITYLQNMLKSNQTNRIYKLTERFCDWLKAQ